MQLELEAALANFDVKVSELQGSCFHLFVMPDLLPAFPFPSFTHCRWRR
jgi:hypothetical protein